MKRNVLIWFILSGIYLTACETNTFEEKGLLVPLTVDEDPSLPSIRVNNTMLHAETYGNPNNPMVVCLHGGPGVDYRSMLNIAELANEEYYVIFYDQRGAGLSQRHNKDVFTISLYLDDLEAVIEHYRQTEQQQVFILGHSWGAMLATAYVNEYPSDIDGVILAEPGGFTWEDTKSYFENTRESSLFGEFFNDYVYKDQLFTSEDHEVLDYKDLMTMVASDFIPDNIVGNSGPYPTWRNGAVCSAGMFEYADKNSFDFTTNLSSYETKVLFAYSELNRAYGKEHAQHVSSAYTNVELVMIEGTGHEIPYFGWDNFYPHVLQYLESIRQ